MENIKKLLEQIRENYEELVEAATEAHKDSQSGDYFQGWNVWIEIDLKGEISQHSGSTGTMTMENFEGKSIRVANFMCDSGKGNMQVEFNVDELSGEEQQEFSQYIYEYVIDWDGGEDASSVEEYLTYYYLCQWNEDIANRIEQEQWEWELENSDHWEEEASFKIDRCIEQLETILD